MHVLCVFPVESSKEKPRSVPFIVYDGCGGQNSFYAYFKGWKVDRDSLPNGEKLPRDLNELGAYEKYQELIRKGIIKAVVVIIQDVGKVKMGGIWYESRHVTTGVANMNPENERIFTRDGRYFIAESENSEEKRFLIVIESETPSVLTREPEADR